MTEKILISWVATNNDFFEKNSKGELIKAEGGINEKGPSFSFHRNYPGYDNHYILSQHGSVESEVRFLAKKISEEFGTQVSVECLGIKDVVSVAEIKAKLRSFLLRFSNKPIEALISTGTPSMTVAWYLLALEFPNLSLLNLREAKHTKSNKPEREYVALSSSIYGHLINLYENERNQDKRKIIHTATTQKVYEQAKQLAAQGSITVLIQGATGTGKELLARYIHNNSPRHRKKFIAINCGAFSNELLESRLFGHSKGSFTDAIANTKGIFEQADGGTIFLDEIGEISEYMQVVLLRALQEKRITPVGGDTEKKVDVRILAATNKDLWQMCLQGKFRFDLYYRLAVTELELPAFIQLPKKERKEIIEFFLEQKNVQFDKRHLEVDKKVWDMLLAHSFPGNIRELENLIERFYCTCEKVITEKDLPRRILLSEVALSDRLEDVERRHIKEIVKRCGGNVSEASRILGISRTTLTGKIK